MGPHLHVCQVIHTHPPRAAGAGGGPSGEARCAPRPKTHAFLRVTDCNSVLVLDQMGSEAHENGDAALPLSLVKPAHRAYVIVLCGRRNHIAM